MYFEELELVFEGPAPGLVGVGARLLAESAALHAYLVDEAKQRFGMH